MSETKMGRHENKKATSKGGSRKIKLCEITGVSKNPKFAQMQGAKETCEHPPCGLPAYPTSQRCIWGICKQENEVSEKGNL
ncbi:MAG: hypothetical protein WA635_02425 [Gallionella sp.]